MLKTPYKMAASSKDKRTPITTPPHKVPSVDVTPDPPTFSLVTTFKLFFQLFSNICSFQLTLISLFGSLLGRIRIILRDWDSHLWHDEPDQDPGSRYPKKSTKNSADQ
jgi:hypothetical protein